MASDRLSVEYRGPVVAINFEIVEDGKWRWMWQDDDGQRDDKTGYWTDHAYLIEAIDRIWTQGFISNNTAMSARAAVFTHYEIWKDSVVEKPSFWERLTGLVTGARW
jgi:hypothetical protein